MPNADVMSAIHYAYDDFERLTQKSIYFSMGYDIREEYEYETYTDGVKTYTSSLVSTLTLKQNGNTTAQYSYTYDSLGNITEIRKNGTTVSRYEYAFATQAAIPSWNTPTTHGRVNKKHKRLFHAFRIG